MEDPQARLDAERLEPKWSRRSPVERQEMLTQAGLTGPFWELD